MKWFNHQSLLRKLAFLLFIVAIVAFVLEITTGNRGMQWLGLIALVIGAVFTFIDSLLGLRREPGQPRE